MEVYNEEIRDLLSKDPKAKLDLRESPERGVYVKGLREFVVKSAAEMAAVLQARSLMPQVACALVLRPDNAILLGYASELALLRLVAG